MAVIAVTNTSTAGTVIGGTAAAAGGDSFVNTGDVIVILTNADVDSTTVTFDVTGYVGGEIGTDKAVAIANGVSKVFGPFHGAAYGGSVGMTYTDHTALTIQVLRVKLNA